MLVKWNLWWRRWLGVCRNWFALRNTTSWLLALLWSLYFRRWSAWKSLQKCEPLGGHITKDAWFLQVELTPLYPPITLNSIRSIPIKHNKCLEQPWQETTAADVWLQPLWFSPKPPDPPSKSTSTDCWAFAWDWLWATFPPCWPLLAAWGSDWSHFLNWSRSKWYCLWTSSSFLCSFFTSDHQCIQRERERVDLQDLQQYWSCCRPYISELFAARVYVLCGDVHYLDVGDLWLFGSGLEILPRVPHVGLTPSCWQNILSGESDIGTVQTAQSRTPSISIQHSQKNHPQQTDHVKFPRRVSKIFIVCHDYRLDRAEQHLDKTVIFWAKAALSGTEMPLGLQDLSMAPFNRYTQILHLAIEKSVNIGMFLFPKKMNKHGTMLHPFPFW